MFDEHETRVKYDYFTGAEGLRIAMPGSYADPGAVMQHSATVLWNHGLGAVVTALIEAGMRIRRLEEHDRSGDPALAVHGAGAGRRLAHAAGAHQPAALSRCRRTSRRDAGRTSRLWSVAGGLSLTA